MSGTFEDLFGGGSKSGDGGTSKFIRPGEVGETLSMVQVGGHKMVPQQIKVGNSFEDKWLVQVGPKDKYKPMGVSQFDADAVENAFEPDYLPQLTVKVVGRLNPDGSKDEDFVPYEAKWDLSGGDQFAKFKDAMLESGAPAVDGTKYNRKFLSDKTKPYNYSIRMKAGE